MPKVNRMGQAAFLTDADYLKIKSHLISSHHKLIFDIAWWTGERLGAVVQLPANAVFDAKGKPLDYITFPARTRKASPDGKRQTRQVPIHPNLREILREYWNAHKPNLSGFLFPSNNTHLQFQTADDALRRALVKAGLEANGISTHSFRRTLITKLSRRGIATATIRKITGHQDMKSLQRYIEVSDDQIKEAIATL
ncbi:tyrosine-type recombinase/integrase [Mastigocladopsis repens]|uniref:tyrosine-type recombinase/integrase n=1 Tax=Mastigocladopsis repens TaxID=221287 RepID=UPI0012EAD4A4|nr:site-specific integrase [Mastigocladopsis repens]